MDNLEKRLPGTMTSVTGLFSCGNHRNENGVGDISLSMQRLDLDGKIALEWPFIDIGCIYYSAPTQEQYDKTQNAEMFSEDRNDFAKIKRRLSYKQAMLLKKIFSDAVRKELNGIIPADDDIPDMF